MKPQDINTTIKRGEKEGKRGWLVFRSEINSFIKADFKSLKERGGNQKTL